MVRVALLFWVAAALAVLVLSNLSPVALTILGTKTLALPLGVWVAGAIGAGVMTTVILEGLFRLTRPVAAPVSARRSSQRRPDRVSPNSFRPPWSAGATRQPSQAATSNATASTGYTSTRTGEQRPSSHSARAAWEDWDDQPDLADRQPKAPASIRDTEDDDWANWEGYEDLERQRSDRRDGDDDGDDDFATDRRDKGFYAESSARTDFEVKREPETRSQSGSVYSFSYRRSEDDQPESAQPTAKPTAKPGEVYDADYRVITPPYRPDPEEVMRPPDRTTEIHDSGFNNDKFDDRHGNDNDNENDEDEDWGLDDELEERGDRPRR